ncbi:MAG: DNA-3-methyladenine glycosylase I [Desulforhopalus sp.]|nr:DNA-3-methyladenine glycosylase I [Desulforhopalus sp.]
MRGKQRCAWCENDALYTKYHDEEWGVPLKDNNSLFAMLCLEGAQAGLSWLTILRRRTGYYRAFEAFTVEKIVCYGDADIERLLQNEGIIRNRLKIESVIKNARATLQLNKEGLTLSDYLWDFVDGQPLQNHFNRMEEIPAQTDVSKKMSRDMKKRGFSFVGPTICYAFMQSIGMVNDHLTTCYRYRELCGGE